MARFCEPFLCAKTRLEVRCRRKSPNYFFDWFEKFIIIRGRFLDFSVLFAGTKIFVSTMILGKARKNVVFVTDDLARGCLFVGSNLVKADFYSDCSCKGNHELNNTMQKPRKNVICILSWLPREVPVAICRLISIRFRKKRQPRAFRCNTKTTFFRYLKDLVVETNLFEPSFKDLAVETNTI